MRILQLRMDYLSHTDRTREEEERLLADLDAVCKRLAQLEGGSSAPEKPGDGASPSQPSDRRVETRTPASFPVVLRLTRRDGKIHHNLAITRDVARHGISLVAAFEARPSEKVTLDLGLSSAVRVADVQAEVRWCTPIWTHPGHYLIGLRFLDLSSVARKALERFGY